MWYCYLCDDTTLYSKCDQTYDLWQQLELASELESDLQDTLDRGRKWLVDFNPGKKQLLLFDQSNNTCAIHHLKCWGWFSLLNWIGALTLPLLLKLPSRKLESWFVLWSFFLLRLLCLSIYLPYSHAQNAVVMLLLCLTLVGWCSSELAELVPCHYSWGGSTHYSGRLHDFSVTIRWC